MSYQTVIIGFGYKRRNGKDTAVKSIIEAFKDQYDVRRYAFGDPLKVEFFEALLTPTHPYWKTTPDYLKLSHPRQPFLSDADKVAWVDEHKAELGPHLQWYGTEFRRAQDPFYWIKKSRAIVESDKPQFALFSDMRFPNEFYFVKAFGGFTVRVMRHGMKEEPDTRNSKHISEVGLEGILHDYHIDVMDGELDELKRDAITVFNLILEKLTPVIDDPNSLLIEADNT